MIMRHGALTLSLLAIAGLIGCEQPTVEFLETKAVEEPLTQADLAAVVAIVEAVGEQEQSKLPYPFLPPPVWSESRTLPVSELLAAEEDSLQSVWSPEDAANQIPKGEPWDSALKSQRLTRQQFCALVLSVTAALARGAADPSVSLKQLAERGKRELESLASDERPFSSLTSDERHRALNKAIWLTIRDRAEKLALVPQENIEATQDCQPRFAESARGRTFRESVRRPLPAPEDSGVPFEERELSDADLTWTASNAVMGPASSHTEPLSSLKRFDRQ